MKIAAANFSDDNRVSAAVLSNIGLSLSFEGRTTDALAAYEEALAVNERVYGEKHYNVAAILTNMARQLEELGRFDEALAAAGRATAIQAEVLPPDHCEVLMASRIHAAILHQLHRDAEALRILEPLVERFAGSACPPPMIGQAELELARTMVTSPGRDKSRARALIESAARKLPGRKAQAEVESVRAALR